MKPKFDNQTLAQKVNLRLNALKGLDTPPVVLETHAGLGRIWALCYRELAQGVAIDKNAARAEHLARRRPSWAVYEGDAWV